MKKFDQCPRCDTKYEARTAACKECHFEAWGFGYAFPVGEYSVMVDIERNQTDVFEGSYAFLDMYDAIMELDGVKLSPKITENQLLKLMILQ